MEKKVNIVSVTVANATSTNSNKKTLDTGKITRLVVNSSSPTDNHNNTDMVRVDVLVNGASIFGDPIAVDNLLPRNVQFECDGIAVPDLDGKEVVCKVIGNTNFSASTDFDFLFIYDNQK